MSITTQDVAHGIVVNSATHMLKNLDAILSKAESYAADNKIDPGALLNARLYPNMLTLIHQVRIATDIIKGGAARLTGSEVPKWADDEASFADLHSRVDKTLKFLGGFKPAQFVGAFSREVELTVGGQPLAFSGQDYLQGFVLPNFYFHLTTAYDILRHNGLAIGKRDFLGAN